MRPFLFTLALALSRSVTAQSPTSTLSNPSAPPEPLSTVCGDIVNSGETVFPAKQAFDCLTSVPFNADVGSRLLQYLTATLQFQSTVAYLKDPPSSYQQPPTDLFRGLDQIQSDIRDGKFPNQYAFEVSLQNLIYSAHDPHLSLNAGILAVFTFASPYSIVSVSSDGTQVPRIYLTDDVYGTLNDPSPITRINDQDVMSYLSQLAASNSPGSLEPHADWNELMSSSALYVGGGESLFEGGLTFYPGENISVTLENGTTLGPEPWLALYNSQGDTGPLATGGDFYNCFVLGLLPSSYNDTSDSTSEASTSTSSTPTSSTAAPMPSSWVDVAGEIAYPANPIVAQQNLNTAGYVTGYLLPESSLAVLSIPSFYSDGTTEQDFSQTISDFISNSSQAGVSKVLIDLQQNNGGTTFLAIDAFKQFFPDIEPFLGSRLRAHESADVIGETLTQFFNSPDINQTYYDIFASSDWVATDRLNAGTGRNFSSWGEFYGPHSFDGDFFTTVQRYDLSNELFVESASGGFDLYGYGNRAAASKPPFSAGDIVILSDGLCSSACAMFMEMMHHEAGVETVVVGGRPANGPMQAPSGSRGAEEYSFIFPEGDFGDLDADIEVAKELNSSTDGQFAIQVNDVWVTYASLNLRDQIRKGEDTPLQFYYEAANCRIFYTPQTIFNYTSLWTYAADATWSKPELCVQGSTGYASTGSSISSPPPEPSKDESMSQVSYGVDGIIKLSGISLDIPAAFSGQELDKVAITQTARPHQLDLLQQQHNPNPRGSRAGKPQTPENLNGRPSRQHDPPPSNHRSPAASGGRLRVRRGKYGRSIRLTRRI